MEENEKAKTLCLFRAFAWSVVKHIYFECFA